MELITKTAFSCAREGLTIRGYEYRPQGEDLPIAIVSHGFMANLSTVKHYAKRLAQLGYAAYCYDFNGGCVMFGRSDGKTTEMSVLTEVKDLSAVIDYACGLPYTNAERILLMGCSQGGFVSALTAAKLKDRIRKLVLFYPALCIQDDARNGRMMWAKFDPKKVPAVLRCGPMKLGRCYVTDVLEMDPFAQICGYQGEVLLVHGTADRIVDQRYSERAAGTYRSEPFQREVVFRTIENGAHGFAKKHDWIAMQYLEQFVK